MTALLVIAILVLLIVVHELGHFIVAKIFRVRVDEFGIGYPPRAFLFGKFGGTEYTLNWLPFGGFVRLFGEDNPPEGGSRGQSSFANASRLTQAIILIAGVTANALLAWFLFAASFTLGVPVAIDRANPNEQAHLYVTDVVPGSPASASGVTPGDEILILEDARGNTLANLNPEAVLDFVRTRGGQQITVTYLHGKTVSTALIRPANAVVPGAAGRPALGIGLALVATRSLSWPQAIYESFFTTGRVFKDVAVGLFTIIRESLYGKLNLNDVVGPVGLAGIVGEAAQNGFGNVLKLAAFISVNLSIINLIPLPALDGGRLLILGLESIFRRSAPRLAVQILNTFGIAAIIMLMVVVTYHDIGRLFA